MKLLAAPKKSAAGHVLITTLVVAGVIGIALCAYLNVISSQNNYTARSQTWNLCMPLVEAGIEEAMAHINNPGTSNFATQGWAWDTGTNCFKRQRTIGNSYYVVLLQTNRTNGPNIFS